MDELDRIHDYFANRADASSEDGDRIKPNQEMGLLADVEAVVKYISDSVKEADANAPWMTEAHMLCSDHGIPHGLLTERIRALRRQLEDEGIQSEAALAAQAARENDLMKYAEKLETLLRHVDASALVIEGVRQGCHKCLEIAALAKNPNLSGQQPVPEGSTPASGSKTALPTPGPENVGTALSKNTTTESK